jgi:large repetitive protein
MAQQATVTFTFTVYNALTITSAAPPASLPVGVAFSHQFTSTGGTAPVTWSVTNGSLPPGLTLSAGGLLSGTPTTPGSYGPIGVSVTDSTP